VAVVGATPVFVDVLEDTYNIDPASLEAAIALVKRDGKLRATRSCRWICSASRRTIARSSPSRGAKALKMLSTRRRPCATYNGRVTGSIGDAASTSFFPAKAARLLRRRRRRFHQRRRPRRTFCGRSTYMGRQRQIPKTSASA